MTPFCLSFDAPTISEARATAAQKIGLERMSSISAFWNVEHALLNELQKSQADLND